jgi:hypothetical protein
MEVRIAPPLEPDEQEVVEMALQCRILAIVGECEQLAPFGW